MTDMTPAQQILLPLRAYYISLHEQEVRRCVAAARAYALSAERQEKDRIEAISAHGRALGLSDLIIHLDSLLETSNDSNNS